MNIFIFCQSAALGRGGMEKVAVDLANYWSKKHFVSFGYLVREKSKVPIYKIDKVVNLLPYSSNNDNINYKFRILTTRPDVVMLFGVGAHIIRLVGLLYQTNIPIILHEGSNPHRIISNNWAKQRKISYTEAAWERELIISQVKRFRVTMKVYEKSLVKEIRYKAKGFPNAFNVQEKKMDNKIKNRIINIGGLKVNKNIWPLLQAFSSIMQDFPEWELVVFSASNKTKQGQDYVKKIKTFVDDLKTDQIIINDEVEDIDSEYHLSDIHVITSLSEGLSGAVAESMCHGIPSIGYKDVPGVDGLIIDNSNGLLVDNTESLTLALAKLMTDKKLRSRLGKQAKKDSIVFNPEVNYAHWDEILLAAHNDKNISYFDNEIEKHYNRVAYRFFQNYFGEDFQKILDVSLNNIESLYELYDSEYYLKNKYQRYMINEKKYQFL